MLFTRNSSPTLRLSMRVTVNALESGDHTTLARTRASRLLPPPPHTDKLSDGVVMLSPRTTPPPPRPPRPPRPPCAAAGPAAPNRFSVSVAIVHCQRELSATKSKLFRSLPNVSVVNGRLFGSCA